MWACTLSGRIVVPFPVCREPGQSIRWVFVERHPGALKRGKCPGEAQSPLSSVYATVPRGSVARQPLRRRMLSQFLCRAVARWNEPLPIAAGDACRAGIIREYRGSGEWNGPEKAGIPCNGTGGEGLRSAYPGSMPAVYLRSVRGFSSACLRKYGTGTCTVPAKVVVNCPWGACRAERRGCIVEKKS